MRARIEVDGQPHEVVVERTAQGVRVEVDGEPVEAAVARGDGGLRVRVGERELRVLPEAGGLRVDGRLHAVRVVAVARSGAAMAGASAAAKVRAPMNGKLDKVLVAPGDLVRRGDVLFVLEAMKMHNEVRSPVAGRVAAVHLAAGAVVGPGDAVLDVAPE
jgi:biotin carboxyl carrier protein